MAVSFQLVIDCADPEPLGGSGSRSCRRAWLYGSFGSSIGTSRLSALLSSEYAASGPRGSACLTRLVS